MEELIKGNKEMEELIFKLFSMSIIYGILEE
jgi:hypothetical protein